MPSPFDIENNKMGITRRFPLLFHRYLSQIKSRPCSSEPLPCRLRARAPGLAPLVPATIFQPLLCRELQVPIHIRAGHFAMDEVAEATTYAAFTAIQATTRFAEICDGRKLAVDWSCGIPP